ncbi:hypothetical protein NW754_002289 [Fusarium falciforme]|nr:hypothetical protein NW754_002289 [Fusarium falciforme]
MAFFPRSLYDSDASFAPLFRLLDDFDSYSRQGMSGRHTSLIEGTTTSGAITEAGEGGKKASEEVHKSVPHETDTEATEKEKPKAKEPVDKAKYWLSERSVGEFSRSFNFPTPVDQESVTASFKDGILNIVAPKAKKQESRRIAIS